MTLPLSEREKLVTMLQRTFPHAEQWQQIKKLHKERLRAKPAAIVSGVMLSAIFLGVKSFQWYEHFVETVNRAGAFLDAMLGGVCVLTVIGISGFMLSEMFGNVRLKRISKRIEQHKYQMRDYVAQTTCIRKVEILLPQLTDHDLNLLRIHPNFNPVFEDSFKKEARRRENLKTIEKINTEFLTDDIAVQSETLYQHNPAQNSPAKVHI